MSPAPSQGPLSRVCGDRVVLRHAPDRRAIRDRIALNQTSRCTVSGCGYPRHSLGALCKRHRRQYEITGHPTGGAVRIGTWRPWILDAAAFVSEQLRRGQPNVEAAISWWSHELLSHRALRFDPARPHTGYSRALAGLRNACIGPDDLLARTLAAHAFAKWDADNSARASSRTFKSDEHFVHQTARLVLLPSPIGAPKWARGNTDDGRDEEAGTYKPPLTVRRYAYDRISAALGVLSLRASLEICKRLQLRTSPPDVPPPPDRVDADAVPFHSNH